jgi:hypothetical protein
MTYGGRRERACGPASAGSGRRTRRKRAGTAGNPPNGPTSPRTASRSRPSGGTKTAGPACGPNWTPIYARLYGLTRKQLRYILDPADLTEKELADILDPWEEVADPLDPQGYAGRCAKSTFPGETFRVLKEKELRQYGEYRTRRQVLEAWQRLCS